MRNKDFANAIGRRNSHIKNKKDRLKSYVLNIEEISNHKILGKEHHPACWRVPFDYSKGEMSNITMDNNRTRLMMNNLDELVNICIHQKERKALFKECIGYYNTLMVMLRKREDFTDEDIDEFQCNADYFYAQWIDLFQAEGVTNYIHMIGCGHVADFLTYYRNLYVHSQQGWKT
jgi:hypothetical protein